MCPEIRLPAAKVSDQLVVPEVTGTKVWTVGVNDVPFHHFPAVTSSSATLALATADPEFVLEVPVMVPAQLVP